MDQLFPDARTLITAHCMYYRSCASAAFVRQCLLQVRLWDTYFSEENDEGFKSFHVYVCAAFLENFADQLKVLVSHIVSCSAADGFAEFGHGTHCVEASERPHGRLGQTEAHITPFACVRTEVAISAPSKGFLARHGGRTR